MIAISRISRGAAELRQKKGNFTVAELARHIGEDPVEVKRYIQGVTVLRQEIGLLKDKQKSTQALLARQYEVAAEALSRDNQFVTIQGLADTMGKTHHCVAVFLGRYPKIKERLGVISKAEAGLRMRMNLYAMGALILERAKADIRAASLSRTCRIAHHVVYNDLNYFRVTESQIQELAHRCCRDSVPDSSPATPASS